MKTLLVIDMQHAWLNRDTARFDKAGVIERINLAARHIRAQGGSVVFVHHCNDEAISGQDGWQLDANLDVCEGDRAIDKTACDSFADTALLRTLRELGTTALVTCGLATEFCVDTTVRASLSMGFDVVALSDAHTTGDRPHLPARQIVEHHNWVWANLAAPAGRSIEVRAVAQLIQVVN